MSTLKFTTKTGRAGLAIRQEPHWIALGKGRHLGYRKVSENELACSWVARFRPPGGRQVYQALGEFVPERREFEQAAKAANDWCDGQGKGLRRGRFTVQDACRRLVEDRRERKDDGGKCALDYEQGFARTVYGNGKKYKPHAIASVQVDRLTPEDLNAWLRSFKFKSAGTKNRTLTRLKAALNLAVRERNCSAACAAEWQSVAPLVNAAKRREVYLDPEQRRALLDRTQGAFRDFVEACALTGARPGELMTALREQFDARQGTVRLYWRKGAKGELKTRTIKLAPRALVLFRKLAQSKLPKAHLFVRDDVPTPRVKSKPIPQGPRAWLKSDYDELLIEAAQLASSARACREDHQYEPISPEVVLYSFRHSWITQSLMENVPPQAVASYTGTSLQMLQRHYAQYIEGQVHEQIARVQML